MLVSGVSVIHVSLKGVNVYIFTEINVQVPFKSYKFKIELFKTFACFFPVTGHFPCLL